MKEKKTAAIVYHRCDFDGICSYAVARNAIAHGYDATPYPYNHTDEAPAAEELLRYDLVIILDICLPAETMYLLHCQRMRSPETFDCLWIDHHESSIALSVKSGFSLMHGYRQPSGKAACALAWDYFHGMTSRVPRTVQLLSAYDIHDTQNIHNDWETEVMPFQYGIREAYDLRAEDFLKDFDALMYDDEFVAGLIRDGGRIYRYEKKTGSKAVESWGFPVTIAGQYKGLCCLTNRFGSLHFEERMRREGQEIAVCVNRIDAERYKVSMFAPAPCTLNLGRYMSVNYGGGGHAGAAGGTLTFEQFKRLITEQKI